MLGAGAAHGKSLWLPAEPQDGRQTAARGFILEAAEQPGMPDILAENLSGKAVTGSDGAQIGSLYNITMDVDSGDLGNLLVTPNESVRTDEFEMDDHGHLQVPVSNVAAVKDHIIVRR